MEYEKKTRLAQQKKNNRAKTRNCNPVNSSRNINKTIKIMSTETQIKGFHLVVNKNISSINSVS